MIYLDNAATTYPKPPSVRDAVCQALTYYGANPGRAGHDFSLKTAEMVWSCRQLVANCFGVPKAENVVFTANCTASLNIVIRTLAKRGGHVIISDLEHNAVVRPLYAYAKQGCLIYDVATVDPSSAENTVHRFEQLIRPTTLAIICTQASNVFGVAPPIRHIGEMAHKHGVRMIVDGAQGAGILPTDMIHDHIDVYCAPGHKGLYGPMGTGILCTTGDWSLEPFVYGGTGTLSLDRNQPTDLPESLESGTLNVVGIAGLKAGVRSVLQVGIEKIADHERGVLYPLYRGLSACDGVQLYTRFEDIRNGAPVLSFNVRNRHSEEVAAILNDHGIACRAGLHCAPLAHRKYGTLEQGTVRLCPSRYTTANQMQFAEKVIANIQKDG